MAWLFHLFMKLANGIELKCFSSYNGLTLCVKSLVS